MKKLTSIATLLVAIIILLAHDVIPHKDHHSQATQAHHQCNNSCSEDHSGDKNQDDEQQTPCCELASKIIIACNHQKSDVIFQTPEDGSFWSFKQLMKEIPDTKYSYQPFLTSKRFKPNPVVFLNPLQFISLSSGLRAPPIFS